ncbi:MAG: 50S ribosomal protein L24 [Gemmatimonas sp. SM23_52]|nr:MAG: 50S ribosomal protein L24 [Gemmatimonas sp. SM23_52]
MHVRKGDQVAVIAGNYKGSEGRVLRVIPKSNRVVVEGINMRKRHQRPSQRNPEGGIVTFEAPIAASNVLLVCPHCKAPSRVRKRHDPDGTLERLCVRCRTAIPIPEA